MDKNAMTDAEKILLMLLKNAPDENVIAQLLQTFISEYGPISEEAAKEVREFLAQWTKN